MGEINLAEKDLNFFIWGKKEGRKSGKAKTQGDKA